MFKLFAPSLFLPLLILINSASASATERTSVLIFHGDNEIAAKHAQDSAQALRSANPDETVQLISLNQESLKRDISQALETGGPVSMILVGEPTFTRAHPELFAQLEGNYSSDAVVYMNEPVPERMGISYAAATTGLHLKSDAKLVFPPDPTETRYNREGFAIKGDLLSRAVRGLGGFSILIGGTIFTGAFGLSLFGPPGSMGVAASFLVAAGIFSGKFIVPGVLAGLSAERWEKRLEERAQRQWARTRAGEVSSRVVQGLSKR